MRHFTAAEIKNEYPLLLMKSIICSFSEPVLNQLLKPSAEHALLPSFSLSLSPPRPTLESIALPHRPVLQESSLYSPAMALVYASMESQVAQAPRGVTWLSHYISMMPELFVVSLL